MVYFDDSGRGIHREIPDDDPSADDVPPAAGGPDEAKVRYVRGVAERYPRATPDEVYAVIVNVRNRHDISRDMVHKILGKRLRPKTSRWRFRR